MTFTCQCPRYGSNISLILFIFFFPSTFCVLLTLIHLFSNFSWALQTDIDYFTVKRDLMI